MLAAMRSASRVLPQPAAPVSVTRREERKACSISSISCRRPMNEVGTVGTFALAKTSGGPAAAGSPREVMGLLWQMAAPFGTALPVVGAAGHLSAWHNSVRSAAFCTSPMALRGSSVSTSISLGAL